MELRVHHDLGQFWDLAGLLYSSDPVRHTVAISVVVPRLEHRHPDEQPEVLITVHDQGEVVGAAVRTPPWGLIASALPTHHADAVAARLHLIDPGLSGVMAPQPEAEAFDTAWRARTGAHISETTRMRLFHLDQLTKPQVPGHPRIADLRDAPLLGRWREGYDAETHGIAEHPAGAAETCRRSIERGDGNLLWEHQGKPVSSAVARQPIDGMSRVGPVYTPTAHRGQGFGSAATAAATEWALTAGAHQVVLFTDLSNPVTNSIYPAIGYRPVHDAIEIWYRPTSA